MASSFFGATGCSYGLWDQQLFDYSDHGPSQDNTIANTMFLHSNGLERPEYALSPRNCPHAAEL